LSIKQKSKQAIVNQANEQTQGTSIISNPNRLILFLTDLLIQPLAKAKTDLLINCSTWVKTYLKDRLVD